MWFVTNFGFFSVVRKTGDNDLTIRARVRKDLENLRQRYIPNLGQIVEGAGTDYRYRAKVSYEDLAVAASRIVMDLDYSNFKSSVGKTQGAKRAKIYGEVWAKLLHLESEDGMSKEWAYGGVVFDKHGRVLLREPTGGFGGYKWTFAKGRPEGSQTPEETALKEVLEETGVRADIIARVPGEYAGSVTMNAYFIMRVVSVGNGHDSETEKIRWATLREARDLISQTPNAKGRERDLKVLDAAVEQLHRHVEQAMEAFWPEYAPHAMQVHKILCRSAGKWDNCRCRRIWGSWKSWMSRACRSRRRKTGMFWSSTVRGRSMFLPSTSHRHSSPSLQRHGNRDP